MPKKTKKLQELANYERDKESKRRAHQEEERIKVIGQESDLKGIKWAKEDFKEKEKEEEAFKTNAFLNLSQLRKKNKAGYNIFLGKLFFHFIKDEDIPHGFEIYANANKKGLVVGIKGTSFLKAIRSSGIEKYDFVATKILAIQVGNTVAKLRGFYATTEGGVALPDEVDKQIIERKKYGR